jgi:hypothetical protein
MVVGLEFRLKQLRLNFNNLPIIPSILGCKEILLGEEDAEGNNSFLTWVKRELLPCASSTMIKLKKKRQF